MGKGINSRNKGSEYERKVAKSLSKWWGEPFQRTPMSGGLHWKNDNRVAGDIVTPNDSKFPFTIECKKRENWTIEQLIKETGDIEKWWGQVLNDCERSRMKPMLIFSKNFAPDYVMVLESDFVAMTANLKLDVCYFIIRNSDKRRVLLLLEDLYKIAPKEQVLDSFGLN